MLKLDANLPQTQLEVRFGGPSTRRNSRFVAFFRDRIWPRLSQLKEFENRYELWMVAIDRALFNDSTELEQWKTMMVAARNKVDSILSDPTWSQDAARWAKLASGLEGELADYARELYKQVEVESYPLEAAPLLERLNAVRAEITVVKNNSPVAKELPKTEKALSEIRREYFAGKLGFDEAWRRIEEFADRGGNAMSQDIAQRGAKLFNEAAVLRTKIARLKGYNNWAELILARQAKHYAPGARTPGERIEFLNGLLSATKDSYLEYLRKSVAVLQSDEGPVTVEKLRSSQLGLLGEPASTLIRDYFPLERIEEIWKRTMLESGVDQKILDSISLDGYPRDGKQTHAYMANLSSHKPLKMMVDAKILTLELPAIENWSPAQIFIVQNFRDDGPGYYETAFHEGGHGLDYSFRLNPFPTQEETEASNSYTETHSMTMERFLQDREFLLAAGETRDGKKITPELVDRYIANSQISDLTGFRGNAANALYDLELWNFAYEEGSQSFMERAHELRKRISTECNQIEPLTIKGIDPALSGFSTDHYFGGEVRYMGYVYADMGAQLSAEKLWDTFAAETGRRSLYRQPTLVSILRDAYYRRGFTDQFPTPIEKFIGKPFSPGAIVDRMLEIARKYNPAPIKRCEDLLY